VKALLANGEAGFRGGERQTLDLVRGLLREGWEVVLAARSGSRLAFEAAGEVECAELPFERFPTRTPAALARLIARWRPAILHAHTSQAHTHLWLARELVRSAPPLVASRRVAFRPPGGPWGRLKYGRGTAHYIPISRAAAAGLRSAGVADARMTIVASGVDTALFANARPDPALARTIRPREGMFVIGTAAAFEREKGHTVLLEAAPAIVRGRGDVRFVLAGEGRLRGDIERRASAAGLGSRFVFLDEGRPLEGILPLLDLYVLPSIEEGLSSALIAALAARLPVVASDTGGIPEVLTAECGILVPPGNADALARAVIAVGADGELRRRMGCAAAERALSFDIALTVRGTIDVYRSVLERIPPR
jgi:glycosyltransferase involved in cell wall biosynthesis